MYSTLAIANEFLKRARREGRSLTHMQLQKLVYLSHGWSLAVHGRELVEDDVEAWEFGPVIRKLYDALKRYGSNNIDHLIKWGDDISFESDDNIIAEVKIDPEDVQIIDKVWETYGKFHAYQLSALTHANGSPWSKTYKPHENRVIDDNNIWDYFAELADAA